MIPRGAIIHALESEGCSPADALRFADAVVAVLTETSGLVGLVQPWDLRLWRDGKKIQAVKRIRNREDVTLKVALDALKEADAA